MVKPQNIVQLPPVCITCKHTVFSHSLREGKEGRSCDDCNCQEFSLVSAT